MRRFSLWHRQRMWRVGFLILLTMPGIAAARDNEQPIQIEADSLTVDESTGVSTYRGNVAVNQGSLQLTAHQVRIFSENEEITRIVASAPAQSGALAHYTQLADGDREQVDGKARTITYYVTEERLELVGDATLSQADKTTVSGQTVNYNAAAGRVDASGGTDRVKTTIRQRDGDDQGP